MGFLAVVDPGIRPGDLLVDLVDVHGCSESSVGRMTQRLLHDHPELQTDLDARTGER